WSTGRMTSLPVPARAPWFIKRARFVFTPTLSLEYQDRICLTRSVAAAMAYYSSRLVRAADITRPYALCKRRSRPENATEFSESAPRSPTNVQSIALRALTPHARSASARITARAARSPRRRHHTRSSYDVRAARSARRDRRLLVDPERHR